MVNNVRDRETDQRVGKRTLAVRLGARGGRIEYVVLVALAYWMLPVYWLVCERSIWVWLPLVTLPHACRLVDRVFQNTDGPSLNEALANTAKLGMIFSLLLAVGWWL